MGYGRLLTLTWSSSTLGLLGASVTFTEPAKMANGCIERVPLGEGTSLGAKLLSKEPRKNALFFAFEEIPPLQRHDEEEEEDSDAWP